MFSQFFYKTHLYSQSLQISKRLKSIIDNADVPLDAIPALNDAISGGKRFRALLVLLVYSECCSSKFDSILDLACAIELLHKASLVHDDIIDNDRYRRGNPTLWTLHGKNQALIIGDLLVGLSFSTMFSWADSESKRQLLPALGELFSRIFCDTVSGEYLDIAFETQTEIDAHRIHKMNQLKSSTLISGSMVLGGLVGSAPPELLNLLNELGIHLGNTFQTVNDLNNWNEIDEVSKMMQGSDLVSRKKNMVTQVFLDNDIQPENLPGLSSQEYNNLFKPVFDLLDLQKADANNCIQQLPEGKLKQIFSSLIKESDDSWFWIDVKEG